jgi:hypothetical protein
MKKLILSLSIICLSGIQPNVAAMQPQSSTSVPKKIAAFAGIVAGFCIVKPVAQYLWHSWRLDSSMDKAKDDLKKHPQRTIDMNTTEGVLTYAGLHLANAANEGNKKNIEINKGIYALRTLSGLGLIGVGAYHLLKK